MAEPLSSYMQKGNKMGFDLTAQDPQTEKGAFFRNNVWYWRPLWEFVYMYCREDIQKEVYKKGHENSGAFVPSDNAIKIGTKLQALILDGTVEGFEKRYEAARKKRRQTDKDPSSISSSYPFSAKNVKDFSEFCINSGGFEIH